MLQASAQSCVTFLTATSARLSADPARGRGAGTRARPASRAGALMSLDCALLRVRNRCAFRYEIMMVIVVVIIVRASRRFAGFCGACDCRNFCWGSRQQRDTAGRTEFVAHGILVAAGMAHSSLVLRFEGILTVRLSSQALNRLQGSGYRLLGWFGPTHVVVHAAKKIVYRGIRREVFCSVTRRLVARFVERRLWFLFIHMDVWKVVLTR